MADLAVLVPTRERVDRFVAMADACHNLAAGTVEVVAYVDDDDPQLDQYRKEMLGRGRLLVGPRLSLSAATNFAATWVLNPRNGDCPRWLASMGDDHLPRTAGWDFTLAQECGEVGWAYGDDQLQGGRLPTAWVQTANLARALGWVMLPACQHMYVDNAVAALGKAADAIRYVPQVVIEHLHPIARKAAVDATYLATNTNQQYARDQAAYRAWLADGLDRAVERVRQLQHKTTSVGR
jgi:hypothetical protein